MATSIAQLPNEVSQKNVVLQVNEKLPGTPQTQPPIAHKSPPTELSQDSIHQIVQGLQQAGGATLLPTRDIPANNTAHVTQDEGVKPNFIPKTKNENYIDNETDLASLINKNKGKKKRTR